MVPSSRLLLGALLVAAVAGGSSGTNYGQARYDRVFSFGDSLTDTGNSAILPATAGGPFTNPPYGETYFNRPNGRASDGRLVIDFIGMSNHSFWLRFHLRALTCIIRDHEFLCLRIHYNSGVAEAAAARAVPRRQDRGRLLARREFRGGRCDGA
jgi:hypothetical protein